MFRARRQVASALLVPFIASLIIFVFPSTAFAAYSCLGGGDHSGAAWDPATDCPGGFAGSHTNIGAFTIGSGETATVQAYTGSQYGSAQISATSVNIASTGTLTAVGKGYAGGATNVTNGSGPGAGTASGGGGAYGGAGGNSANGGVGGSTYGSYTAPTDMGSGGGGGNAASGAGGGAIQITTTGTTTISGTISASGANGSGNCGSGPNGGSGGAGGSIYITTGTLAGAGTVTDNGGNSCTYFGSGVGNGGGGRIYISYSTANSFSGSAPTVNAGTGGAGGQPGTSLLVDSTNHDLYLQTSQTWDANPTHEGQSFSYHSITVSNSATWTMLGYYTTNSNGVGMTFNTTNFTLNGGSTISLVGTGYAGGAINTAGAGTGAGGANAGVGGGAGYGGAGGSSSSPGAGGSTYGSYTLPTDLGSGGGGGDGAGGAGGGAIQIAATGTATVSGTISANGVTGNNNNCGSGGHGGGAGSGGSVYISAGTFTGGGTITANGANACNYFGAGPGNGGGGRVAIYYSVGASWSGNALNPANAAKVGVNGLGGANGTVIFAHYSLATTRSITISDATPSATGVSYKVVFTPGVSTTVGGIVVDICDNDPIIGDASCTFPSGFDWGGATPSLTVNSGMGSGWTAAGIQAGAGSGKSQVLELSNATPQSVSTATPMSFTITSVTNPSTLNHSFYARILTFTDSSSMTSQYTISGTTRSGAYTNHVDFGSMALSTGSTLGFSFIVPESLSFCVSGSSIGSNCSGATAANLVLGHGSPAILTSSAVDKANAYTQLSTNASLGAVVRMINVRGTGLSPIHTLYQRPITIDNTANASTLTNYDVAVTVDTASLISAGKMRSDCGDVRITDSDQVTLLSYWLASGCNTSTTIFWVKVPSITASSTKTIYIFYGEPTLATLSNGVNTFVYYDDFSTNTTGNYVAQGGATISYDAVNLLMKQTNTGSAQHWIVGSTDSLPNAYVYEADVRVDSDSSGNKHAGLVTDFLTGAATGYRLTHLNATFVVSKWLNGTETAIGSFADGGIYTLGSWLTERVYRNRSTGLLKYEITNGTTTVSQTYSDTTYTTGHIGFHSYGDSVSYDNIHVRPYSPPDPSISLGSESSRGCGGLSFNNNSTCGIPAVNLSCAGGCSATTISAGTAAFGMCVLPGSGSVTATAPYDGASCGTGTTYGLDDTGVLNVFGSQIYSATGPLNNENDTLTFAAAISGTTPGGTYSAQYVLMATGTY